MVLRANQTTEPSDLLVPDPNQVIFALLNLVNMMISDISRIHPEYWLNETSLSLLITVLYEVRVVH